MTSATSERAIKKRNERAKADRTSTDITIRALMSTIHGRRWMWLQLSTLGPFLANNHNEPAAFGRQEGLRQAGLQLLGQVQRITPQLYMTMTTENTGVQVQDQTNDDRDATDPDAEPYLDLFGGSDPS